jgi:hypothetical protein
MRMDWLDLTFVHWRYSTVEVQRLLPPWLSVQTFDGSAWVGLVPFDMRVRPPVGPNLPWLSAFPETNVRTYVRAADGSTGIWFFSLDAGRLPAVMAARSAYRLPYFWSDMSVERDGDEVAYRSRRRWPGPSGARADLTVLAGEPVEIGPLEDFLTMRFAVFAPTPLVRTATRVEHEPWPLRTATVVSLEQDVVQVAGLPAPKGDPLVHFSPGVSVRTAAPNVVGGKRPAAPDD